MGLGCAAYVVAYRFGRFKLMTDDDAPPERVDLEALDLGAMARHARTATFAPNWKSVLAADGSIGVAVLLGGVALFNWVAWAGVIMTALGVVYTGLVVRRFLQWRWIRRRAGLQ